MYPYTPRTPCTSSSPSSSPKVNLISQMMSWALIRQLLVASHSPSARRQVEVLQAPLVQHDDQVTRSGRRHRSALVLAVNFAAHLDTSREISLRPAVQGNGKSRAAWRNWGTPCSLLQLVPQTTPPHPHCFHDPGIQAGDLGENLPDLNEMPLGRFHGSADLLLQILPLSQKLGNPLRVLTTVSSSHLPGYVKIPPVKINQHIQPPKPFTSYLFSMKTAC